MSLRYILCAMLMCANVALIGSVNTAIMPERISALMSFITEQYESIRSYEQRYGSKNEPLISCLQCSAKHISLGEVIGAITGKALNDVLTQVDTYNFLSGLLQQTSVFLKQGSAEQIKQFMSETLPLLSYKCPLCGAINWGFLT